MNIKVCGVTSLKQLQQLDGLDIDFAGLIFYKQSPRYIVDKVNKDDIAHADLDIKKVGVFVNEEFDEIMQMVEEYGIDVVQLHGDESPYLCEQISNEVEVIKSFRLNEESDKSIDYIIQDFDEVCDYYLFDISQKEGSGETIKQTWKKISGSKIEKPFFLTGGLGPTDGSLIKSFKHPDFYGVNLTNKFEKEPGKPDMALVLKFLHSMKMPVK